MFSQRRSCGYFRIALTAVALAGATFFPLRAVAASVTFRAELKGAHVVPSTASSAVGFLHATYDTESRVLTWTGTHSGLSSKVTRIAFHGPASPNETAGIVESIRRLSGGSAILSEQEAADLIGGYWNITIHTRAHDDGEIRGQLLRGE